MSRWDSLFDQAVSIINQANYSSKIVDDWSFGGGTALMLQIDHRESFDIDLFIDDPQVLPYLNPQTQGYNIQLNPDEYRTDGTRALKIVFAGIGEIDFICAPRLTAEPVIKSEVRGVAVDLETPAEIIAKKIFYRGASLQPRDIFDIACVARECGDEYLVEALAPFKDKAAAALGVTERMNADFARTIMSSLQIRDRFSEIPQDAQATSIRLLRAVTGRAA